MTLSLTLPRSWNELTQEQLIFVFKHIASNNTVVQLKTVFLAMRHQLDNMTARQECMDTMRELFRQFMSVLIQEKTRVMEEHIYLDPRISLTYRSSSFSQGRAQTSLSLLLLRASFQEIDTFFFSGCAFTISIRSLFQDYAD